MSAILTTGNTQVLVPELPQNQTIAGNETVQAASNDSVSPLSAAMAASSAASSGATISIVRDNPIVKYIVFGGLIYFGYKFLRRK